MILEKSWWSFLVVVVAIVIAVVIAVVIVVVIAVVIVIFHYCPALRRSETSCSSFLRQTFLSYDIPPYMRYICSNKNLAEAC